MMQRRSFIKATALSAVAASLDCVRGDTADRTTIAASDDRLASLTAVEATAAIRRGDVTAERYATALLDRADRLKGLNAYIALDRDGLRERARAIDIERKKGGQLGTLAGLPLFVKDNIDTASLPTTAGSRGLAGNRPRQNAPVLQLLLAQGALVMAKANMHELACGITSSNVAYGAVRNPYDQRLISGGSSGGTAAAIAARLAPAGLGSDTGGSVRIPSALCGIVGLRPSVGNGQKRYSSQGVVPISHTRDTIGPMGRTVADVALLDTVITAQPAVDAVPLKGLRLGVPRASLWADLDPALARVAESALKRLEESGAVLVEVNLKPMLDVSAQVDMPIALYELIHDLPAYLASEGGSIAFDDVVRRVASKDVAGFFPVAKTVQKETYDTAMRVLRPRLQQMYADAYSQNTIAAMVFPTTPVPARPINEGGDAHEDTVELNGRQASTFLTYIRNTSAITNAGLPGLSVPVGMTDAGLPVGIEFDGPVNTDRVLLGIGMSVERLFGTLAPPTL